TEVVVEDGGGASSGDGLIPETEQNDAGPADAGGPGKEALVPPPRSRQLSSMGTPSTSSQEQELDALRIAVAKHDEVLNAKNEELARAKRKSVIIIKFLK
ncbi:unnamed protein product, partial [Amoebophrya sp. A25]